VDIEQYNINFFVTPVTEFVIRTRELNLAPYKLDVLALLAFFPAVP